MSSPTGEPKKCKTFLSAARDNQQLAVTALYSALEGTEIAPHGYEKQATTISDKQTGTYKMDVRKAARKVVKTALKSEALRQRLNKTARGRKLLLAAKVTAKNNERSVTGFSEIPKQFTQAEGEHDES